eukprot:CAMPEP_0177662578 /NCGR_PEP_ID=MMETSP0447-20121125/19384_1 /TAXON_ID=0 /ORGANISM="Stygamoeba regulata, Strain BSH-02190019" /LENGTH=131 /DNA_ID=CAMNT_0019168191 /DNA_START=49 /DNA_END=445 /DNA_ORIENTATION=-
MSTDSQTSLLPSVEERYALLYATSAETNQSALEFAAARRQVEAHREGSTTSTSAHLLQEVDQRATFVRELAQLVSTHLAHVGEYMSDEKDRRAVRLTLFATYVERVIAYLFSPETTAGLLCAYANGEHADG